MSENMIERVAKIIWDSEEFKRLPVTTGDAERLSRAVIEGLRNAKPTPEMMSAMWSMTYANTAESFTDCWRAMIDAALKGGDAV